MHKDDCDEQFISDNLDLIYNCKLSDSEIFKLIPSIIDLLESERDHFKNELLIFCQILIKSYNEKK